MANKKLKRDMVKMKVKNFTRKPLEVYSHIECSKSLFNFVTAKKFFKCLLRQKIEAKIVLPKKKIKINKSEIQIHKKINFSFSS